MNYDTGYAMCCELMDNLAGIFIDYNNNQKSGCIVYNTEIDHLKNVYTQMTNIKGNLNSILNTEKAYTHATNMTQLQDGLFNLFRITKENDPWIESVRQLCKELFNWPKVDSMLSRIYNSAISRQQIPSFEGYRGQYGKFFEFQKFTEEEAIRIMTEYPYLSKIYTGNYSIVYSIGAMMI